MVQLTESMRTYTTEPLPRRGGHGRTALTVEVTRARHDGLPVDDSPRAR